MGREGLGKELVFIELVVVIDELRMGVGVESRESRYIDLYSEERLVSDLLSTSRTPPFFELKTEDDT